MSSISSLTKAVSGIKVAQKGLQVTGHNLVNANTQGYTRQQLLQHESPYINIGQSGGKVLQVGLGVSPTEIRQIRDDMADARFRVENSVLSYYNTSTSVLNEITNTFDEPYGEGLSKMLQNMWSYAQKLDTTPDGVDERSSFINSANVLIQKVNYISDALMSYQLNTNEQVEKSVKRVNEIIEQLGQYNEKISEAESNGDHANDYRDQRNLLLDELCEYGEVTYFNDGKSNVTVMFEGREVVNKVITTLMDLKPASENSTFKVPCWADTKTAVYNLEKAVSSFNENDKGSIKALLVMRGNSIFNENMTWKDVALDDNLSVDVQGNSFIIPEVQMKLKQFTEQLTDIVNNSLTGTGIGVYQGEKGVPVFVNKSVTKDDKNPDGSYKYRDALDPLNDELFNYDLYHQDQMAGLLPGNTIVNPELMENGGYNKLGTVNAVNTDGTVDPDKKKDTGDNSLVTKLLSDWKTTKEWYPADPADPTKPTSKQVDLNTFFTDLVAGIGTDTQLSTQKAREAGITTNNINNERQAMGGVAMDEEFSYMLKYQYAYNASSRVINVLDSMLDTIINRM